MSHTSEITPSAVLVDLANNTLRLSVDAPGLSVGESLATLDVGSRGRLIGMEIGETYIAVMDSDNHMEATRSAEVRVHISVVGGTWVTMPRRGEGWEITYPSWNSCWTRRTSDGTVIRLCADVVGG